MQTLRETVSASSGNATIAVPAGPDRTVVVNGNVDWTATAATYPAAADSGILPILTTAYGATAVTDIAAGRTVSLSLSLGASGTRILLPTGYSTTIPYVLSVTADVSNAPELSFGNAYVSTDSGFDFDRFGYLYFSSDYNVYRVDDASASAYTPIVNTTDYLYRMAIGRRAGKLFYVGYGNAYTLYYSKLSDDLATYLPTYTVTLGSYQLNGPCVAADDDGNSYCQILSGNTSNIARIRIDDQGNGTILSQTDRTLLGISADETINDMRVLGDSLYLAVSDSTSGNRGKIVRVGITDMGKVADYGWASVAPTDPMGTDLFGPTRFLGYASGKLYFSDEDTNNNYK